MTSPEQQAAVAATAFEIAGHLDAAQQSLAEAYGLLSEVVGHPDGADVAVALRGMAHGEHSYGQLLLLAGDVRARGDQLLAEVHEDAERPPPSPPEFGGMA